MDFFCTFNYLENVFQCKCQLLMHNCCVRFFFVLLLCSVSQSGTAQAEAKEMEHKLHAWAKNNRLDSIRQVVPKFLELTKNQTSSSSHHWAKYFYAVTHYRKDFDQSLTFALEAVQWFEKNDERRGLVKASYLLGNCYSKKGNFFQSQKWYVKTKNLLESQADVFPEKKYYQLLCATYNNLSRVQFEMGEFETAYENILLAESILDKLEEPKSQLNVLLSMSNFLAKTQKLEESLNYLKKGTKVAKQIGDKNLIGMCLFNQAQTYRQQEKLDSALVYLYQAWDLAIESKNEESQCTRATAIAGIYRDRNQFEQAAIWYGQALGISKSLQLTQQEAEVYKQLAKGAIAQNQSQKAISYIQSAIDIQVEQKNRAALSSSYEVLHDAFSLAGDFEFALLAYRKGIAIKDSLLNESTLATIEELQAKYKSAEQEKEIAILENENKTKQIQLHQSRLIGLSIAFLGAIFLLGGWLYYKRRLERTKFKIQETEQNLLRTQMNPHFTFNALTSIQTYLQNENDSEQGGYFLAKYAKMMRQILAFSRTPWITLEDEISFLENYLTIQKLRYHKQFSYSIEVEPTINAAAIWMPPLFLQPAIENALVHGKVFEKNDGQINITVSKKDNNIQFQIEDNGVGRTPALQTKGNSDSYSTKIIQQRIDLLRKKHKVKIKYTISDLMPTGTVVSFLM